MLDANATDEGEPSQEGSETDRLGVTPPDSKLLYDNDTLRPTVEM